MSYRRSLDPEEQALWNRVVQTVTPLQAKRLSPKSVAASPRPVQVEPTHKPAAGNPAKQKPSAASTGTISSGAISAGAVRQDRTPVIDGNLDSHWERRFKKAAITPDVTVDLHGAALSGAYARLDAALEQAIHHNMRVILLITGKPRRHDRASGQGRGAIAAIVHDWLAASRHASRIAAVRGAHPRHGGAGALYIILKR